MWKRIGIGFGVVAWIASAVGFYLQLRTSNFPEVLQGGILVAWIAAGLIVISFVLGRELGEKKIVHTKEDENNADRTNIVLANRKYMPQLQDILQKAHKEIILY